MAKLAEPLAWNSLADAAGSAVSMPAVLGRLLLDPTSDPAMDWTAWRKLWHDPPQAVRDELGHSRPAYRMLLLHAGLKAMMIHPDMARYKPWPPPPEPLESPKLPEASCLLGISPTPDLQLWACLLQLEQAALAGNSAASNQTTLAYIHDLLAKPGKGGSLYPMESDDSLDGWTWRELVGLHALAHLCALEPSPQRLGRLREAVAFHLEQTQPDNTTSQPWALAGFVLGGAVALAQQQLHDLQTQAMTPAGARPPVLTGLLLADAVCLLRQLAGQTRIP